MNVQLVKIIVSLLKLVKTPLEILNVISITQIIVLIRNMRSSGKEQNLLEQFFNQRAPWLLLLISIRQVASI